MRFRGVYARVFIAVISIAAVVSCSANSRRGDTAVVSASDSLFRVKIALAKERGIDKLPIGEAVAAIGKLFLGAPYVGGTLDRDSLHENLVVDLQEFDCVTFYENAFALARTMKLYPQPTRKDFEQQLTLLRYRGGIRDGYASRLHYSTDYFFDASAKGIMTPITKEVGGPSAQKDVRPIDFMSNHRASYKQLKTNDTNYARIIATEQAIAKRGGYYYIPKDKIEGIESGIKTGDILGITTSIKGLDCSHTGIAIRMPDGRVHFMHASSLHHEVIISDEPLAEYLTHSNSQTGIIVNRPIEPKQN